MQTNGQEQQQEPTQIYAAAPSGDLAAAPVLNPPDSEHSAAAQAAQIEAYLDAVCLQMPAEVPADALANMRLEMRGHLEAAIIAHCELGQTEAEALQSALTQFGPPRAVAQQWQQEWTETLSETQTIPARSSLKVALRTWALVDITTLILCMALPPLQLVRDYTPLHALAQNLLVCTIILALPLIAGAWIGLRVRRHAVFCTLIGNLILSPLLAVGCMGIGYWSRYYALWLTGKTQSGIGTGFNDGFRNMMSLLPTWLIISLVTCGIIATGRHIRKHIRRRQIAR